jgi:hypothetical protein
MTNNAQELTPVRTPESTNEMKVKNETHEIHKQMNIQKFRQDQFNMSTRKYSNRNQFVAPRRFCRPSVRRRNMELALGLLVNKP